MSALLKRPLLALLLLMTAFVALHSPGERKLFNPDEGRYSEISREMAETGDFVTPRLNGLKYFEKPPLQYWATAIAFKLFGESEFTARLYITLCGLGCILLVAYTGTRVFDDETGLYAGLVMLSALYVMLLNGIVVLDVGLTFWLTLAVSALMISVYAANDAARRRWLWLAWAAMALAVLSKGLIGIVFPAAAVFLYCVVQRDLSLIRRLEWVVGPLVFLAIVVPWFVLVWQANPEHPRFFFIHEHFERFLTTVHKREQPWWSFVALLLVGFLPWALALIPAAIRGWREVPVKRFAPHRFLLIYAIFILLFFSKSGSKLPHYIAPMFPVLTLVIAAYVKACDPKRLAWFVLPVLPLTLWGAYATGPALAARANDFSRGMYAEVIPFAVAAVLMLAIAALLAFLLLRADKKSLGVAVLAVGTMMSIATFGRGAEHLSPIYSGYALSEKMKPHLTPETRLYSVGNYEQTLPFYIKRTITLVDYVDEFNMGQKLEPHLWIPKREDFAAAWNAPGKAMAIIPPLEVDKMRALGIAFEVIHMDPRRAAIKK